MYCPFCGKKVMEEAIYCVKCGKELPLSANCDNDKDKQTQKTNPHSHIKNYEIPRDVKNPLAILEGCGGDSPNDYCIALPSFKDKLPDGKEIQIDWLSHIFHLIITDSAIIFVAGTPPSKVYKATEEIGRFAIAAGPLPGLIFVAAPLAIFSEAYEKLFINKNKLDYVSLCRLFDNGMAGYFMRDQLRLRYIEIKGGFFGDSGNMFEISGLFITNIGKINSSITLSDSVLSVASPTKKALKKAGFSLENNKTTAKSLEQALKEIGHLPDVFKI